MQQQNADKITISDASDFRLAPRLASPMALRKFSMSTSVFLTSAEYTSAPTIGQKGTFVPSSCAMPKAKAVLPVPGAPARESILLTNAFADKEAKEVSCCNVLI